MARPARKFYTKMSTQSWKCLSFCLTRTIPLQNHQDAEYVHILLRKGHINFQDCVSYNLKKVQEPKSIIYLFNNAQVSFHLLLYHPDEDHNYDHH